ncbi:PEP-CTERM sorting domain-containing protein [bacterium]|nr:MAG: PEP-CTERM sorting domain-containing protein [bacterium]
MLKSFLLVASIGAISAAASAQTSFYGGDADLVDGMSSYATNCLAFDDFSFGSTATVTDLSGNFLYNGSNLQGLYYEIRSGMSAGNGGTLVASGTIAASKVDTDADAFGFNIFTISGSVSGVTLAAGAYHLGLAALDSVSGAYLATTSGANGYGSPIHNGNSFSYRPDAGAFYSDSVGYYDYSIGVNTQAVPEPASLAALGLGGLALLRRRKSA